MLHSKVISTFVVAFSALAAQAAEPIAPAPKVLWVHRSPENFIAAPVAAGKELYVSALGAFNSGVFHALAIDPAAKERLRWSKQPPFLKIPSVSSPAIVDGKVIFGDGMHQTDGATLHCLAAGTGRTLWELPVPGELVHIEGSPAVAGSAVYFGAGNGGVIAVDAARATFEGREQPLADVDAELGKRWKVLLDKYEQEKKTDPDFAIAPSEDQLPKAAPKVLWKQGAGKWHVDAGVCVAGERVLVGSAYLDQERTGDRALYCLKASDGGVLWRTLLNYNPWGGPIVADGRVIVGTSSVRLDPSTAAAGRGELVCCDLEKGTPLWRKPVSGGIVAPAVVAGKLVLFTATDGKLRAVDFATGEDRWTYDAGAPLFSGAALAGEMAYLGDLRGIVHAVNVADGKKLWTLDLTADPAIGGGGQIYGTPCLFEGRLFVATCNLESPEHRRPNVVVCVGVK